MQSMQVWLDEYANEHQNPINKQFHWVCVPLIVWSLLAILWSLPFPGTYKLAGMPVNWAIVTVMVATIYYFILSPRLAIGLLIFNVLLLFSCFSLISIVPWALWKIAVIVFVIAWVGQFIGHHIEGKRPAFFKDIQFLMIGPAWVIAYVYRTLSIRY